MFTATDRTTGSDIKRLGAWGRERTTRTTRTRITVTKSYIT